eukprot:gene20672-24775_t
MAAMMNTIAKVSAKQLTPQLRNSSARVQCKRAGVAPARKFEVQAMHRLGDTSGLSVNQIEFLKRKHGLLDPAPAPEVMPPPEPVQVGEPQLSEEQRAFMMRKEMVARGEDPWANEAPVGASPAPAAPHYSAEQMEFLQRRATEGRAAYGLGNEESPKFDTDVYAQAAADNSQYSAEQLEFLQRRATEGAGAFVPAAAAAAPVAAAPAYSAPAPAAAVPSDVDTSQYSPEQLEFLARRAAEKK